MPICIATSATASFSPAKKAQLAEKLGKIGQFDRKKSQWNSAIPSPIIIMDTCCS
jgi:hypothetical protein